MQCPYCGTDKLTETFNFNEHSCDRCGCEFKYENNLYRIFVEGNYEKFCEAVLLEMTNNTNTQVGNILIQVVRECKRYGPEQLDIMIEHIKNVAETVLSETKIGLRDRYDLGTLVEGLEAFDTLGKTLLERAEDLEIDMHSYSRYLADNNFKESLNESKHDEEGDGDEDSDYWKIHRDKAIKKNDPYKKGNTKPKDKKPDREKHMDDSKGDDENEVAPRTPPAKIKRGYDRQQSGPRDIPRSKDTSKPKGKKPERGGVRGDSMEESVSLDTPVKKLLESKTLTQIAEETDINEQLVVEAAALGKTLGDLFEADMNAKDTHGKEDWDGSDLPGEGAKEDRTDPTDSVETLEEEGPGTRFTKAGDKQAEEIMKSLRKQHPDWDEEKVKSVAYATVTNKNPEKRTDMDEEVELEDAAKQLEETMKEYELKDL